MLLPLADSMPRIHRPYMTWSIIAVTLCAFFAQQTLTQPEFLSVIRKFGLTPAALPSLTEAPHFFSYAFLHASWMHVIGNMWMTWIFADNVEDIMGPMRFLLFYLVCGALAGLTHAVAQTGSSIPVVGASGAVSGVLGAYFVLYPHAKISTLVMYFIIRMPAVAYLGSWFLYQLVSGLGPGSNGIAWLAHLGGFAAGALLFPAFKTNRPLPTIIPQPEGPPPEHDPNDPWAQYRSK